MSNSCATHRLPRARIDPIDSESSALTMITHMMSRPAEYETIALLLDDRRRGLTVLVVSGTDEPDAILDVADLIAHGDQRGDELGAVVLASVRPGGQIGDGDIDRWLEATDVLADRGIELVEWFVIGTGIACPRDRFGEAPRWGG